LKIQRLSDGFFLLLLAWLGASCIISSKQRGKMSGKMRKKGKKSLPIFWDIFV